MTIPEEFAERVHALDTRCATTTAQEPLPQGICYPLDSILPHILTHLDRLSKTEQARGNIWRLPHYVLKLDELQNQAAENIDKNQDSSLRFLTEASAVIIHAFMNYGLMFFEHDEHEDGKKIHPSIPKKIVLGEPKHELITQPVNFETVWEHIITAMDIFIGRNCNAEFNWKRTLPDYANAVTAGVRKMQAVSVQHHLAPVQHDSQIKRHMHLVLRYALAARMLHGKPSSA